MSFMTPTCGYFPKNAHLRTQTSVPLALSVQPLAEPPDGAAIQAVSWGSNPVVRCKDCRAYINPYATFVDNGTKWECNFCHRRNDVSSFYYSPLDGYGARADLAERPELSQESVEIIAPAEYTVRPPQEPAYLFVIDVSTHSVQTGMLEVVVQSIRKVLSDHALPGQHNQRVRVGFVTFDSCVHFYNLRPSLSRPQIIVCSDVDDIFVPQPEDLFVNLADSQHLVDFLLDSLVQMYTDNKDVESCLGAAVHAATEVMMSLGGRMLLFTSQLPSIGPSRLQNREDPKKLGTDHEHTFQSMASINYKEMAVRLTKFNIGCDIFQCASEYCDVATVSALSKFSSGQNYYYPRFHSTTHGDELAHDLYRCLTREQGWEAVMRVRASRGVAVDKYFGNFFLRGKDLLSLPTIDCDKTFSMTLGHTEQPIPGANVFIQSALLYTTSYGERRIRVHTMAIPIVSEASQLYDALNIPAVANIVCKQAVGLVVQQSFRTARELVQDVCLRLLGSYRSVTGASLGTDVYGEYPETLNLLPEVTLGLLKCAAFRDTAELPADMRSLQLSRLNISSVAVSDLYLRPRLFSMHELSGEIGLMNTTEGHVVLPQELPLSSQYMVDDGAYLLDNGFQFVLRLGAQVSPHFLQEVFGVSQLPSSGQQLTVLSDPGTHSQLDAVCELPAYSPPSYPDTSYESSADTASRFRNVLRYLRSQGPFYQRLTCVVDGEPTASLFTNQLMHDRTLTVMALHEFAEFILQQTGGRR